VGNLSAHALQFARFKRKRLGASKYSNLIFERFIGVFSANQKIVNLLHFWEDEEGMRTFTGEKINCNFCVTLYMGTASDSDGNVQ
jgi:hypothetical protein